MKKLSFIVLLLFILSGCGRASDLEEFVSVTEQTSNTEITTEADMQAEPIGNSRNGRIAAISCGGQFYSFYVTASGELERRNEETGEAVIAADEIKSIRPLLDQTLLVLTESGDVYGEGENDLGQLYDTPVDEVLQAYVGSLLSEGKTEQTAEPHVIISDAEMIAAGNEHCLALKKDGTVWAWGEYLGGQLGIGEPNGGKRPTEEGTVSWRRETDGELHQVMSDCREVEAKGYTSAAITKNNELYLWGSNSNGQIGNGKSGKGYPQLGDCIEVSPVKIMDDVRTVKTGTTTYAITLDNALWAWGEGYTSTPQKISDDVADVIRTSTGTFILRDNSVYNIDDTSEPLLHDVKAFAEDIGMRLSVEKTDGSLEIYEFAGEINKIQLLLKVKGSEN